MLFRIGGDRYLEVGDIAQAGDQLGGIGIAFGVGREARARNGAIAAQGNDVAHASGVEFARHFIDFGLAGIDTGEVGGNRQAGLADQVAHRLHAAVPAGSACTVGDRDEARGATRQLGGSRHQALFGGRVGRGEELEGDIDVSCQSRETGGRTLPRERGLIPCHKWKPAGGKGERSTRHRGGQPRSWSSGPCLRASGAHRTGSRFRPASQRSDRR